MIKEWYCEDEKAYLDIYLEGNSRLVASVSVPAVKWITNMPWFFDLIVTALETKMKKHLEKRIDRHMDEIQNLGNAYELVCGGI